MSITTDVPESLFPRLEPLLARVAKPIQYVGGELNSVVKDWASCDVRWCLMYPDAYEIGQPNQGVAILYEVLNERENILAERTYAVWPDLEALMRKHDVPQFSLDTHRPVGAFDVLGVSFATELGYTNLLTAIDLAGIPLHAVDRREEDPIVLAGGHAAFNPEPIADFIDAAVLGDGEEIALAISSCVSRVEGRGSDRAVGTGCCSGWRPPAGCTSRSSTTWTICPTARSPRWCRTVPACRPRSPSTP